MKITYLILLLTLCASSWSSDERPFEVANRNFKYLFNKARMGQPTNIPWPASYWTFEYDGISQPDWDRKTELFIPGTSPAEKWDDFLRLADKGEAKKLMSEKKQVRPEDWGRFVEDLEKNPKVKVLYPAATFERDQHSCRTVKINNPDDPGIYKGCLGWWGHCNAWSAAAIKEVEPRTSLEASNPNNGKSITFGVRDQKAFLTAIYMEHNIFVEGYNVPATSKTNEWVLKPKSKLAKESDEEGVSQYEKFWDPSPETFFLLFTNFMGVMKQGLAIDRFTGDEVWNQPVAGYRILPIRSEDIHPVEKDKKTGRKIYPVSLRMKLFWGDDKVEEGGIGLPFDIYKQTKDTEEVEDIWKGKMDFHWGKNQEITHYDGRLLKFKLFFDKPLLMSSEVIVKSVGKIVGGIWDHQENPENYLYDGEEGAEKYSALNHTHPDFIWSPIDYIPHSDWPGERNPYLRPKDVLSVYNEKKLPLRFKNSRGRPLKLKVKKSFQISNLDLFGKDYMADLNFQDEFYIKENIAYYLGLENVKAQVFGVKGIMVNHAKIGIYVANKKQGTKALKVLRNYGFKVKSLNNKTWD